MNEIEQRLADVRAFASSSPYYQAMGMSIGRIAEGRVVQSGRRLSFAEVDIRDAETDRSVARGSGTFVIEARG